nr:LEA type 2 family protein [Thermococcus sp. 18S1]
MGKWLGAIVVVVILLGGLYVYSEYEKRAALQNCEITLSDVRVASIGLTGAKLEIVFRIYNPNDVTATLDRIEYELYGNGEFLGYGYIDRSVDIPARSIRYVSSEFTLDYGGALKTIWSALKRGDVDWRVKGTLHIDTPIGTLDVPFEERA